MNWFHETFAYQLIMISRNFLNFFREIVGELGDGAFGKVHKARHRVNRDLYAAAKICVLESEDELEDFTVEIDILTDVSHNNVIELYEAFYHQDKLWVRQIFKSNFRST